MEETSSEWKERNIIFKRRISQDSESDEIAIQHLRQILFEWTQTSINERRKEIVVSAKRSIQLADFEMTSSSIPVDNFPPDDNWLDERDYPAQVL